VLRKDVAASMYNTAGVSGNTADPYTANNSHTLTVGVYPSAPGTPMWRYRLYGPVTQEHMYTLDVNEYNGLAAQGWIQEGTAGKLLDNPGSFDGVPAVPYYRLYSSATGWHHWTSDANEFEAYDKPGGTVVENTRVKIKPD
jgi:uncharacterized protein DUF5648